MVRPTRNRCGRLEDCGDLWVHFDAHVLVFDELGIPRLDSLHDPLVEWLADHGVKVVAYVLLAHPQYFALPQRQRLHGFRIIRRELQRLLDVEALILRNVDVFDICCVDPVSGTRCEVTKMPDRDVLVEWDIGSALDADEAVDLYQCVGQHA